MGAISAYFTLILIFCQAGRWASIALSKFSNKIAERGIMPGYTGLMPSRRGVSLLIKACGRSLMSDPARQEK